MPVSDPIADLLTRIRNAQHARTTGCRCPWSRHKEEICTVLKQAGFLEDSQTEGKGEIRELVLTFAPDRPPLELKRVSKPGRRVYMGVGEMHPVLRGLGIAIVTTNQGLMTDKEARKRKVGGEVLCTIS